MGDMKVVMLDYEKHRTEIDEFNAKVYAVQYILFYKKKWCSV